MTKTCSKCGRRLPAATGNFYTDKRLKGDEKMKKEIDIIDLYQRICLSIYRGEKMKKEIDIIDLYQGQRLNDQPYGYIGITDAGGYPEGRRMKGATP